MIYNNSVQYLISFDSCRFKVLFYWREPSFCTWAEPHSTQLNDNFNSFHAFKRRVLPPVSLIAQTILNWTNYWRESRKTSNSLNPHHSGFTEALWYWHSPLSPSPLLSVMPCAFKPWVRFPLLLQKMIEIFLTRRTNWRLTSFLLGSKPQNYGMQRQWGAVGWGIFTLVAGYLIDMTSGGKLLKGMICWFAFDFPTLLVPYLQLP